MIKTTGNMYPLVLAVTEEVAQFQQQLLVVVVQASLLMDHILESSM